MNLLAKKNKELRHGTFRRFFGKKNFLKIKGNLRIIVCYGKTNSRTVRIKQKGTRMVMDGED